MRPAVLILGTSVLAGCGAGDDGETGQEARPRGPVIEFAHVEHDMGSVPDTDVATHVFPFTNTGDEVVEIVDFRTSCGCTQPSLSQTRYEPGESGELIIEFKPKGRGTQTHWVQVLTSSPTFIPERLTVSATVVPLLATSPSIVRFGTVPLDRDSVARLEIVSADPDLVLQAIRPGSDRLEIRPLGVRGDSTAPFSEVFEVVLRRGGGWGSLTTRLEIDAVGTPYGRDEPTFHSTEVIVSATVFGTIRAEPDFVRVGVVSPGGSFRREVLLTSARPFELLDARLEDSTMPGVTVRTERHEYPGRNGYRLTLSGSAGGFLGQIAGELVVRTDRRGEEELRIRFAGMVREPG